MSDDDPQDPAGGDSLEQPPRRPRRWMRVLKWSGVAVAVLLIGAEVAVRVLGLDPPPVLTHADRENYKGISQHLRYQYRCEAAVANAKWRLAKLQKEKAAPEKLAEAQAAIAKAEEDLKVCERAAPSRKFTFRGYWSGVPVEFEQEVELNHLWLRDYEYDVKKPPNVRRLIILGDSYTTAWEVPFDAMYHKRLASDLTALAGPGRKVEVPAFSVPAMGLVELRQWFLDRSLRMKPDLIALVVAGTLVSENYAPLQREMEYRFGVLMDYFIARARRVEDTWLLVPFSALNRLIARTAAGFYVYHLDWFEDLTPYHPVNPAAETYFEPETEKWRKAWENTAKVLEETGEICRQHGVPLLLVLMPTERGVNPIFTQPQPGFRVDADKVDRKFAVMCKKAGIDFMSLTPAFDDYRAKHGVDYEHAYDIHWNVKGHLIAEQAILAHLKAKYSKQLGLASSGGPVEAPNLASGRTEKKNR